MRGDGKDFVGKFVRVPKIIFECRPDDLRNSGLVSKNENIAMISGF